MDLEIRRAISIRNSKKTRRKAGKAGFARCRRRQLRLYE
jgi:hypothetical protein